MPSCKAHHDRLQHAREQEGDDQGLNNPCAHVQNPADQNGDEDAQEHEDGAVRPQHRTPDYRPRCPHACYLPIAFFCYSAAMPRYLLPLIFLLGLAALTTWLLLPPGEEPVHATPQDQEQAGHADKEMAATPIAPAPTDTAPALAREEQEELPISAAVAEGMVVTVLGQPGDKPMPNMDVYVQETQSPEEIQFFQEHAPNWSSMNQGLRIGSKRYRSNAQGQVTIPMFERGGSVYAIGEGLLGFNPLVPSELSGTVILVYANPRLNVVVQDQQQRPVSRALVLLRSEDGDTVWGSRLSDSQGRCTLEYPNAVLIFIEQENQAPELGLDVAVLGGLPRATPLPLPLETDTDVVLQLPEASRIRVHLTDAKGNPFPRKVDLHIALQEPNVSDSSPGLLSPLISFQLGMLAEHFPLEFGALPGVGMIEIRAETPDRVYSATATIAAPTAAGQVLDVPLQITAARPKLQFVVRNEAGQLGKRIKIQAHLANATHADDFRENHHTQADEEGFVELTIDPDTMVLNPRELQVFLPPRGKHPLRLAVLPLPQPFVPGVHHLGDAVLKPAPIQLSGFVSDSQGQPIAMAGIRLYRQPADPKERWPWVDTFNCQSQQDGSFALRGMNPPGVYRIETYRSGYRTDVQEIQLAGQEMQITLPHQTQVSATLIVDPGIRHHDLRAKVEYLDAHGAKANRYPRIGEDFTFSTRIGSIGDAKLIISCARSDRELHVASMPNLAAGGSDYAFGDIDLRGKIHTYEIAVGGESGQKIEDVYLLFSDGATARSADADFHFLSPFSSEEVLVGASQYRTTKVTLQPGKESVLVQPGITIDIVVTQFAGTPQAERSRVHLRLLKDGKFLTRQLLNFDTSGRATVTVSDAGQYVHEWQEVHRGNGETGLVMLAAEADGNAGGPSIEVQDLPGQVFHLSAP